MRSPFCFVLLLKNDGSSLDTLPDSPHLRSFACLLHRISLWLSFSLPPLVSFLLIHHERRTAVDIPCYIPPYAIFYFLSSFFSNSHAFSCPPPPSVFSLSLSFHCSLSYYAPSLARQYRTPLYAVGVPTQGPTEFSLTLTSPTSLGSSYYTPSALDVPVGEQLTYELALKLIEGMPCLDINHLRAFRRVMCTCCCRISVLPHVF